MSIKKLLNSFKASLVAAFAMPLFAFAPIANAATSTVTVTPSNTQGWSFNPDPTNATPYVFNDDEASIGAGSLYVLPIGGNGSAKFIAAKVLNTAVENINSVSYDFLIAGNGDSTDANQFYLNVYTNLPSSSTFYDCRFDYTPTTGSTIDFTTITFSAADTPAQIGDRADGFTCPATLDAMPEDSTVSFIALNVGDTSTNDAGLAGYFDNVIVSTDDTVTYDFEPTVTVSNKDACKNNGWTQSNTPSFKNQGDCVSYFASKKNNGPLAHLAYGAVTLAGPTQQLNFAAQDNGFAGTNEGLVNYANPDASLAYTAQLTCANVTGNTAYFAYVIPAGNPYTGTWVVWKVIDGTPDTAGFTTASDMASANALCESGSFTPTNYAITDGDIVVQ